MEKALHLGQHFSRYIGPVPSFHRRLQAEYVFVR